jgi:tetratricopeptide (TPR) repeat protein
MSASGVVSSGIPLRAVCATVAFTALTAFASADISTLLAQGDAFDARLDTAHALESYLEAERLGSTDVGTLNRIARQYALSMNDTRSEEQQRQLGEKALAYAMRAIETDPNNAKAQLSVAICYGRLISLVGARTKVEYSRLIKEHADLALKLDPSDSYAWHVLGAWNYELAQMSTVMRAVVKVVYGGVPPASNEEAVRLFRKAVELAPERVSHHAELGRALLAQGDSARARGEFETALALPSREKDDPESKRRAREALRRLSFRYNGGNFRLACPVWTAQPGILRRADVDFAVSRVFIPSQSLFVRSVVPLSTAKAGPALGRAPMCHHACLSRYIHPGGGL